ncbi:MAG: glycosyltransferase family 9 protein [Bacteroidetes bacterium]|nr:glycosyltransferase family 9 protein [Bacteroidota bacterium]
MATFAKHIERAIRRGMLALLGRSSRRRAAQHATERHATERHGVTPIVPGSAPRILLLRHDRIGDAIVSTPIVAALRERYPAAEIVMLLGVKNAAAAPLLGSLNRTLVLPRTLAGVVRTVRELRRSRFDLVINLLAKDSASAAMLTASSGARWRIGFAGSSTAIYDSPVQVPDDAAGEHIVRRTWRLLGPLGIPPLGPVPLRPAERLSVVIPADGEAVHPDIIPDGCRIAINISGSSPQKYWGRENYARLARELRARGMHPVIAGAPSDADEAAAIAALAECRLLPPMPDLARFAEALSISAMVTTPDTSIVHIAAALGKPVVELVADPETGNIWGPWGVPFRIVAGDGTIASITASDLLEAITTLAGETSQAHTSSSGT